MLLLPPSIARLPWGLVLLAGSTYLDELKPLLWASYALDEPMAGLSMGRRLAWLKERVG